MGKREAGERTFVHRIVLYDLLKVNEKRKTYECEECGERIQRTKGDPSRPCRSCTKRFSEGSLAPASPAPHIHTTIPGARVGLGPKRVRQNVRDEDP